MCLIDVGWPGAGTARASPARPRQLGAVVAVLVSLAILTGTGGLAYLVAWNDTPDRGRIATAVASPLRVKSVTPAAGAVAGTRSVQVTFSAPIAASSAMPRLSPATRGRWQASGRVLTFTPDAPLAPATRFTLRIVSGPTGLRGAAGGLLAGPVAATFRTEPYSRRRLLQLLGELGYLPLSWRPIVMDSGAEDAGAGLARQQALAYNPPAGKFTWKPGYPATLRRLWQLGRAGLLVRGAVMAFQAQHGFAVNGVIGPRLWRALFIAADNGKRNAVGYTYAVASKKSPETLTIWHDGLIVLRSPTNTGIAVDPTASGTFPVYRRFRNMVMSGTNPDGSRYADPVSFVSYFNGRDAVHYFPRGSYGSPQSLGCVELPYQAAARAYQLLTYGALVTVTG
jgi:peptidoglycan hydrolase-like protein with peptidoglycan-binding domain